MHIATLDPAITILQPFAQWMWHWVLIQYEDVIWPIHDDLNNNECEIEPYEWTKGQLH